MALSIGEVVRIASGEGVVRQVGTQDGRASYLIEVGESPEPVWIPEEVLESLQDPERARSRFNGRAPSVLAIDDFFRDPDEVRVLALAQDFHETQEAGDGLWPFPGLHTRSRFLWPGMREELGRLVGAQVSAWPGHRANGTFQQARATDPLVWCHGSQGFAAVVHLTPDAPPETGTSFWRDRTCGCRRRPAHPLEEARLGSPRAVATAEVVVDDPYNLEHDDNWELVESVAGIYNRLVIWDASLIHSATSYGPSSDGAWAPTRLVQLFLFDTD